MPHSGKGVNQVLESVNRSVNSNKRTVRSMKLYKNLIFLAVDGQNAALAHHGGSATIHNRLKATKRLNRDGSFYSASIFCEFNFEPRFGTTKYTSTWAHSN